MSSETPQNIITDKNLRNNLDMEITQSQFKKARNNLSKSVVGKIHNFELSKCAGLNSKDYNSVQRHTAALINVSKRSY